MKRLKLILCLLCFFTLQKTFSQENCEQFYGVQIYPTGENITSNSAFLIDFSEKHYKIKEYLDELSFTAISSTGKKHKLSIIESNFSGDMGQFFLKSKSNLKIGDTISISISLKNTEKLYDNVKKLDNFINWKKWIVMFPKDKEKPKWISLEKNQNSYILFKYSSGLAVELYGFNVNDNSFKFQNPDHNSIRHYCLIEFNEQRFICSADHTTPRLFNGYCNGNFQFDYNTSYSANITAIDNAGNFSRKKIVLNFFTQCDIK